MILHYHILGHKTTFINTCLKHARISGDVATYVGDVDEVVHASGTKTFLQAVKQELDRVGSNFAYFCSITLRSFMVHTKPRGNSTLSIFSPKRLNPWRKYRIAKDSVGTYGKSIHNPQRVTRAGVHKGSNCSPLKPESIYTYARRARSRRNIFKENYSPKRSVRPNVTNFANFHFVNFRKPRNGMAGERPMKNDSYYIEMIKSYNQGYC